MHPTLGGEKLRSGSGAGGDFGMPMSKLKAWRKRQLVPDGATGALRTMRITDVPRLYPGIGVTTWHSWEQPVGHKDFKRPNDDNMRRLCVEITKGELAPADFYRMGATAKAGRAEKIGGG